ncbi:MAG: hypothetical protein KAR06_02745 [Deltaproteobacteria bacterium]|nr:hypothetical protein [Deltaproteobacteria bacterium]
MKRLTEEGPFSLESRLVVGGGSLPLTTEERESRKGRHFKKGSGKPIFNSIPQEVTDELRDLVSKRIEEISEQ